MQERFTDIYQAYTKRKGKLLMEGRSQHPTSHGYWAASEPMQVFELFKQIGLQKHKSFIDLGSGDGIIVAIASLFTQATGIEVDPNLHKAAEEMKEKLKAKYTLKNADYLEEDLSRYDIIFIYPDNYFHKLEKKLVEDFKGTLVIADTIFRPLTLNPEKQISVRGTGFSIYILE
ncbi:hypothetical protein ACFL3V_03785 [Nanoarchaeota archaeon]